MLKCAFCSLFISCAAVGQCVPVSAGLCSPSTNREGKFMSPGDSGPGEKGTSEAGRSGLAAGFRGFQLRHSPQRG